MATITLPSYVSSVLDSYVRQYIGLATVNTAVNVTVSAGFPTADFYQVNHGLLVGQSIYIITPISVGGQVLQGYYLVSAVPDPNDFQVIASSNFTSTVPNGGVVPQYTTIINLSSVTVTLPNHGLSVGSSYNAGLATAVGGVTINGGYTVQSVPTSGTFTINSGQVATSSASAYMNGGQAQI